MLKSDLLGTVAGVTSLLHFDEGEGTLFAEQRFDCEEVLRRNAAYRNDGAWKGEAMHHVADIPLPIYNDLVRKGIADDPARFAGWLNDPDNAYFRTSNTTV